MKHKILWDIMPVHKNDKRMMCIDCRFQQYLRRKAMLRLCHKSRSDAFIPMEGSKSVAFI